MIEMIKKLTPPILIDFIKKRKNRALNKLYSSYDLASKNCTLDAYQNNQIVKVVIEKTIRFKDSLKENKLINTNELKTLAGIGLALAKAKSANVLDFGGGGGYHYFLTKQFFSNISEINWRVVETVKMVKEAEKISNNQLAFFSSITEAKNDLRNIDLIFTSGALQCCAEPYKYLQNLLDIEANHIYISRTALIEDGDELCIIHHSNISDNGPGPLPDGFQDSSVTYPVVFLNKNIFEEMISEKYNILLYIEEEKGAYHIYEKPVNLYGYFLSKKPNIEGLS